MGCQLVKRALLNYTLTDDNLTWIIKGINVMRLKDSELTIKILENAYFIAKGRGGTTTQYVLKATKLRKKHAVEIDITYQNCNCGGQITDYFLENLANNLKDATTNVNFYIILTDGSTDVSITEKEAIFTIHFNPSSNGEDQHNFQGSY